MDANDLINPLRYVNLKNINPESINRMGEGVFPEPNTLDHLAIIDLVTKAYQGVHMPTLGHPIPQSTVCTSVTVTDSQDSKVLVTAAANEVLEVIGLAAKTPASYTTSGAQLQIRDANSNDNAIMDLSDFDNMTATTSGVFYGLASKYIGDVGAMYVTPTRLFVNGGDSLILKLSNAPSSSMIVAVTYRKVIQ